MKTPSPRPPEDRLLLGPGPSPVPPSVLRAMAAPLLGHLDPDFLALMDGVQESLRTVFGTRNRFTLPLSGTGSAGMEALLVNLLEPGDAVVVAVNGLFGERMTDVAARAGARVVRVDDPWGSPVDVAKFAKAVAAAKPVAAAFVHAETSTGALSDAAALAKAARDGGALPLMDCVTSLGGLPVEVDAWGIAAAYSGTQKCLASPPGLSPVTVSDAAIARVRARKTKVPSWYLDFTMLADYWGEGRTYHHTAPVTAIYGLRESLRLVEEEGLEARFARHRRAQASLVAGLEAMALRPLVASADHRLPPLTAVEVPAGVDDARLRKRLLAEHGIEIGGGLGPLKGKIFRIGLMGHGARVGNVVAALAALSDALRREGHAPPGDPIAAALAKWAASGPDRLAGASAP